MLEIFEGETIKWALLHEGPILRTASPTVTSMPLLRQTIAAERCRYMDLITSRDNEAPRRWRVILREGTEQAIIQELEDIGLVEVPKGAEDPEDLKRVWVKG
jgi:hypothetical protein